MKRQEIPQHQLIMGLHAVKEVLTHAPEKLIQVFMEEGKGERKGEIATLCDDNDIQINFVPKSFLDKLCGTTFHQGIGAQIRDRTYLDVREFLKKIEDKENSLVLMVDQIFDPQNFGSLIRSAECFGADAIVWSKNRGVDLTPTVSKASCGASEIIDLIRISNLADTVTVFQKAGFTAIATLLDPNAKNAFEYSFPPRTLLIVGSEGEGIQPLIQKRVDLSLYIPMSGKIQSLNVANATSVLLSFYSKKYSNLGSL